MSSSHDEVRQPLMQNRRVQCYGTREGDYYEVLVPTIQEILNKLPPEQTPGECEKKWEGVPLPTSKGKPALPPEEIPLRLLISNFHEGVGDPTYIRYRLERALKEGTG